MLWTSALSSRLAFIDGAVVNAGRSALGRDLARGGADLSRVASGYLLPLGSLLLRLEQADAAQDLRPAR